MAELIDELEESMDDIGLIKAEYMSKITGDEVEEFNSSQVPIETVSKKQIQELVDSLPKPMFQKPFQPGASPIDDDNRFLCWNSVGIIRAVNNNDDTDLGIDVMFHDAERHSYINFTNDSHFTFGSMSDDVIVVGSNGKHGNGPAKIMAMNLLEPNRDNREWDICLPPAELIEALAAGSGFVAVVSDLRFLRLLTNGGMQCHVVSLPGQVLSIASLDKKLMIVYHNGAGDADDQNLSMIVYHIDLFNGNFLVEYDNIPVSLSKRSPLAWIGLSDEGTPCTYDYHGILRIYYRDIGWMPLINLRDLTSSALDHYFVVGVNEASQSLRAAKCKRSRWPDIKTETAGMLNFKLPFSDVDSPKGKLEEEFARLKLKNATIERLAFSEDNDMEYSTMTKATNEKLIVNSILKLFALYLKENKEEMAKNLVYMMPLDHVEKLPEFAWKTNRKSYFVDSLNKAIEERQKKKSL